jgi:hypothetical protein
MPILREAVVAWPACPRWSAEETPCDLTTVRVCLSLDETPLSDDP